MEQLKANNVTKEIYVIASDEDWDGKTVTINQIDDDLFWKPEEIVGFSESTNISFFKNHEDWYCLIK